MARKKETGEKKDVKGRGDIDLGDRYRKLFEASQDAIMLLDRERFFDCNPATLRMFGLTREQFIRLHPSEISPPRQPNGGNSRTEADNRIDEAFQSGTNKFEWIHRRSNGEDFLATVWLTAFTLEGRQVLQATVREVTTGEEAQMDLEAHRLKLQILLDERSEGMQRETGERKRAEREVRRLIAAIETSFNAVAMFDLDMKLLYANNAFQKMSRYSRERLKDLNAFDFIRGDSVNIVRDLINDAMDGDEIEPFELEVTNGVGGKLWVEVAATLIYEEDGLPEGYLVIINDITERRVMMDVLRSSEEKFKMLVEHSMDGIVIIQDGKVVYMNPTLVRLSGYTDDENIGRDFLENVVPEDRERVMAAYKARMNGEDVPTIYETRFRRKDGSSAPVEVNATVMEYNGRPADFVYIRDLTESRRAVDEIRTTKERLEYILGATRTGYDIIDPEYNVVYVDPAWASTLGDYRDKKCFDYFMGVKKPCDTCAIQKALETGKTILSEEYLKKEDRYIEVHTIPFRGDDGKWLVAEFNIDITDRKKALQEILENEIRYRELANGISSGLAVYKALDGGKDFEFLDFNVTAEKMEGIERGKVIGKRVTEVFPGIHEMGLLKVFRRVWKTGIPEHHPITMYKDERLTSWRENYVYKLPSGELVAIYDDVTEKKEAEDALRESEERFRTLFQNSSDVISIIDADGRFTYNTPSSQRIFGYTPDELAGKLAFDFVHPDDRKRARRDFDTVVESQNPGIPTEFRFRKKDGTWAYMEALGLNLMGHTGVNGMVITSRDITQRKLSEQALKESELRYRTLMEKANDAIFLADAKTGLLIDVNEKACDLIGMTRGELIGLHQTELHPPKEVKRYEKIFRTHVKNGTAKEENIFVVHKDGRKIPVSISASIIEIQGRVINQGIFHDLTERVNAEKALRESDERIRSIFTSMEDLVFGFDAEGVFTSCQSPQDDLLYIPQEMFLGKRYSDIMPPHVTAFIDKGIKRNKKRETYDFEYSLDVGGKARWFSAKMSPIFIDDKFSGSVAVVRDITEKKAVEKSLRTSEQVYKSLYESTTALGELRDLDRFMEVIAAEARNMLEGVCSTIYLWDEGKGLLIPYYSNVSEERDKFMAFEMPLGTGLTGSVAKSREGSYANFNDAEAKKGYVPGTRRNKDHLQSIIAEPLLHEDKLLGVMNVIAMERIFTDEDLAKLRILARQTAIAYAHLQSMRELQASEERFRRMAEGIHDGLTIIENGAVTYINDRAVEIYGYTRDELMRMTHLDLIVPEDREQMTQIIANTANTGASLGEIEFWIQRKDGGRRYVRTRSSTTIEGSRTGEFIITTDITARKQAEDANKRMLMKFLLEDGRLYLVKEFRPSMSIDALNDLLNLEYVGLVLSRTPKKDLSRSIHGAFEHTWLGEKAEKELLDDLLATIRDFPGKSVVFIDRLDYLVFRFGFKETLDFIFKLRDLVYLKEKVVIISVDPTIMKEEELNVMQKEMNEIEARQIPRPGEDIMEIAQVVYDKNNAGIKPSYSEIGEELKLSKPTFRKRVRRLINGGYAVEVTKGNRKVLELTQKGRSLFFK